MKHKVLVTGASGFIGRRLVQKLSNLPEFEVVAILRDSSKRKLFQEPDIKVAIASLSDDKKIKEVVRQCSMVVNLAYDFKSKDNLLNFNKLVDVCLGSDVDKFVHISSAVVYDQWGLTDISERSSCDLPGSEYKNTKVAMEKKLNSLAQSRLLNSIIIQPTIVYGPNSWLWTDHVMEKLVTGVQVLPKKVDGVCNAVYVDDVADSIIAALKSKDCEGEKFLISGKGKTTWRTFFESYNALLKKKSIEYIDLEISEKKEESKKENSHSDSGPIEKIKAYIHRRLGYKTINKINRWVCGLKSLRGEVRYYPTSDEVKLFGSEACCDIDKAKELLNFSPRHDFESGFSLTKEYLLKEYKSYLL